MNVHSKVANVSIAHKLGFDRETKLCGTGKVSEWRGLLAMFPNHGRLEHNLAMGRWSIKEWLISFGNMAREKSTAIYTSRGSSYGRGKK